MAKSTITYTQAITEIEEILVHIENEDLDVDDLTQKVKRVAQLLQICKDKLHSTEKEVEKIIKDMDEVD